MEASRVSALCASQEKGLHTDGGFEALLDQLVLHFTVGTETTTYLAALHPAQEKRQARGQSVCAAGKYYSHPYQKHSTEPIFRAQRLISSGVKAAGLPASGVNGRQWSVEAGWGPFGQEPEPARFPLNAAI